jgi:Uma2 family endonuclease
MGLNTGLDGKLHGAPDLVVEVLSGERPTKSATA